jgi:hypothetical protein
MCPMKTSFSGKEWFMKGLDEKISVSIKQLLDLSEALWGDNPKWPFFRKLLLKNLNELRRDLASQTQVNNQKEN